MFSKKTTSSGRLMMVLTNVIFYIIKRPELVVYVFKKDYKLRPLDDVENYIGQNHHLPDMLSAEKIAKEGINLGETDKQLTKKVEELTLYLIEVNKQLKTQQEEIKSLKKQLKSK